MENTDERTKAIDALVRATIEVREFDEPALADAQAAARLGASSETIDMLFEILLKEEGIKAASEIVELGVSQNTIDELAKHYLEEDQKSKKAVRKVTEMTDFDIAVELAKLGASKEVKDLIMKDLVGVFLRDEADNLEYLHETVTKFYGEEPVPREIIDPLIDLEIDGGWVIEASRLANKCRKEPLTTEEIKRLTEGLKNR